MWNLSDYETVEERLEKFWKEFKDGRIETELVEQSATRFIVRASIYRTQSDDKVWATGLAEETVSTKGVNQTSALENCETSAIGRALANAGYAAKGKRASREEMGKVIRIKAETIEVEKPSDPWVTEAKPMPTAVNDDLIKAVVENLDGEEIARCAHGDMRLKEGIKNNKPWRGYICSNSGSITDVCPPRWQHLSKSTGKWVFND